ncbi:hypothetical protein HHK36_004872 [Tetracentron sinense]|uniref:Uncharacterized protein n=1 Tax=Tetracentron sinense TaxID=13715 RepID=A0A834ZPE1_TETSI|nr:hypothetical protein HHK36_004872 [Tetracentron sinense]
MGNSKKNRIDREGKDNMSKTRANSSPELLPSAKTDLDGQDDATLEGVAANVKLLLKLIQDHNEACTKDNDGRKTQRVAGMMTILDDVKARIQKSQSFGKKREAELRRCNTDLRSNQVPRDRKQHETITDEKQKLRNELNASLAARKSLERMFSSLGKEKEIMAAELSRKVQELDGMEEHINDLKAQNEMLLAKVQACAKEHKEKKCSGGDTQGNAALQERNKALSEQLLKSLDGYRSLKKKLKEAQVENAGIKAKMAEMAVEVAVGLDRIHDFQLRIAKRNEEPIEIEEELSAIEQMFQHLEMKFSKYGKKRSECIKPKANLNAGKPPVIA